MRLGPGCATCGSRSPSRRGSSKRSPGRLFDAARLLRRFHDATIGFEPPPGVDWQVVCPPDLPVEVICHNDFAPYNAVFREGRLCGIIDFETISPGARVWDVAHAAYRVVPLSLQARRPGCDSPAEQARRLRLFCAAYGLGRADRAALVGVVVRRVAALRDLVVCLAAEGDAAGLRRMADGDADEYADDVACVLAEQLLFGSAL